ncbi:hypothetical protein Tco_0854922 [Tanacetum coccineum]
MVNLNIYTSALETVPRQQQSIRSDLNLEDAGGTDCLPTATIFEELARMGYEKPSPKLTFYKAFFSPQWKFLIHTITQCLSAKTTTWNEFSSTMASAIICLAINQKLGDMSHHKKTYVNPSHTKKIFANMKREGKDFSGRVTPLFATMMVQSNQEEGADSDIPTDSHSTPIITQPSSSKPQKKNQAGNKGRTSRALCTGDYKSKSTWEIESLKKKVESSNDVSLGAQEDASKQGRKITDLDADAEVTLVDETQEMNDDNLMFDTGVLEEQEKEVAEKEVSAADPVTTAGEVVTTANVEVTTANAPTTTIDELTLAQTLIEIKAAKPKAVTSAATTTTTTRPKARGVVVQEPSEFKTTSSPLQASQLPQAKDKGKAKMVEPEKPLKKKDQIAMDEEVARNLEAQLQAELEEEERISRLKEEKANIALLESWDNTQAMMDADFQLAQQMQTEEQEQLSIEEKSKLFVELLEKRKKHFATLRAQEKRSNLPTKAQKRNTMSTYLKNMFGYKHNQLKSKSYDEIQEMFDKEMKKVNTFVDMNTELVKSKINEHVEAEKDDDQEEAEMKKHIEIVKGRLRTLGKLVKAKHGLRRPEEDYERVLWGDLKVMFEPDVESECLNAFSWANGAKCGNGNEEIGYNDCAQLKLLIDLLLLEGLCTSADEIKITEERLRLIREHEYYED